MFCGGNYEVLFQPGKHVKEWSMDDVDMYISGNKLMMMAYLKEYMVTEVDDDNHIHRLYSPLNKKKIKTISKI